MAITIKRPVTNRLMISIQYSTGHTVRANILDTVEDSIMDIVEDSNIGETVWDELMNFKGNNNEK